MPSIINGFIIFSLIITIAYILGLLTFVVDHEKNRCDMTYMFEYPQFVRISNRIDEQYPQYALYAYSEGVLTQSARNMHFTGIPVLFIPGNAGSYKQVRSMASVALRKSEDLHNFFHFDYFTVDLNGEYSGLNGALLYKQLDYVNQSIYRILQLYEKQRVQPTSVILFGHSMGGIITRRLVASLPDSSDLVPIVLTLATPHKRAPLYIDFYLDSFYKEMRFYEKLKNRSQTTFINLGGGYNDFLVPSYLTQINKNTSLDVVTTHIPLGWLPVDHLCILWCKQLVLTLNRALFDCVDRKTKQIHTDPEFRQSIFYHHLVRHSGTKPSNRHVYESKTNQRNQGNWIESIYRQYTINLSKNQDTNWYMIRLINNRQHEALTVVAINLKTVDWVFVCGAHIPRDNIRVCEEFHHLTQLSEIAPSVLHKRRTLRVNLHELMQNNTAFTHVVVRVLPTNEPVVLHFDVYNVADRQITVNLPNMLSIKQDIIMDETPEKIIHLDLILPQLQHLIQTYRLYLEPIKCQNYDALHSTASIIVPWSYENYHHHFTSTNQHNNEPLLVRLSSSKPLNSPNQSVIIRLTLDPNCRYRISIKSSIFGILAQLARFYTPLLYVNIAAVVLMALNVQLKCLGKERRCNLFFDAIKDGAKPYYILTSVKLISRVLSINSLANLFEPPDWLIMAQEGVDFFLLPLLLYVCSVGIVWIMGVILGVSLTIFETTIHKLTLKFLAKTVSFTISWSDYIMSALHKVPYVVAAILIGLSLTTTGSLALCVGLVFYFLRLTQLSQDFIEEIVWSLVKKIGRKFKTNQAKPIDENPNDDSSIRNAMFFHFTIFLIWLLLTIINVPSALTWAHNFKYSTVLRPDPSFLPGFVLSIIALPLWQMELPKVNRKWYEEISQIVVALAVISLIYAPITIFRLNYTLTAVIVVVMLHQMFGPNRDDSVGNTTNDGIDDPDKVTYDTVKTKLE